MLHMHLCGRVEYPVRDNVIKVFWECFSRHSHFPFLWQDPAFEVHVRNVIGPLSEFTHI